MENNQVTIPSEDDGSLAFLRIPRDENSRSLQGEEVKQSRIVNTTFWVHSFLEDIPTRFSKSKGTTGQTLVQIRPEKDSPESEAKKFSRVRRTFYTFCVKSRNSGNFLEK